MNDMYVLFHFNIFSSSNKQITCSSNYISFQYYF